MRKETSGGQGRACVLVVHAALGLLLLLAGPAGAQDSSMEEFEEVDPYTKGERELMDRLGYVSFGPFHWADGDSTSEVAVNMGDMPMLWVETEHFRIGSSLVTYKLQGDRDEKERVEEELDRLKDRLGKLKGKKRELDPWLRLHLYAQRAEELYAAFAEDFGLEPSDYEDVGPYLGRKDKFMILLCQRKSEFVRHMNQYLDVQVDSSYRWRWNQSSAGVALNIEFIKESWYGSETRPYDAILHCQMASALTSTLVEGFRQNYAGAPYWLGRSLAHSHVRRIDPRWVSAIGTRPGQTIDEDDYKWEPRVKNLVANDFYASTEEMFGWKEYGDLNVRDHMVGWSRIDYLLNEVEGDHRGFFLDLCRRAPTGSAEAVRAEMLERQTIALAEHYELTPADLDEAWAKFVKKRYKKR